MEDKRQNGETSSQGQAKPGRSDVKMKNEQPDRAKAMKELVLMRRIIEMNTTRSKTYFLLIASLVGSALYIVGLFKGGLTLPEGTMVSTLGVIVGMMVFGLFFPLFVCVYFARGFLASIRRLENAVFPEAQADESEDED